MIERCSNCLEKVLFSSSVCPNCGADQTTVSTNIPGQPPRPITAPATQKDAKKANSWLGVVLVSLVIFSFFANWILVTKGGSIDYRNRVTGARLLVSGNDPYHYKWQYGQPDRWCDIYDNPALPITKTTVSPTMLLVSAPLAMLPYPSSQRLWLVGQWALLAGIWFMWWRHWRHSRTTKWWWTALVVAFTYTLAWHHHIDRGQAYVLLTFLLGLWMQLSLSNHPKQGWFCGLVAGLLICLRPPLLLVIAPFVLVRRRNQWLGAVIGLALGLAAPILFRSSVWSDYAKAMNTWSEVYRTDHQPRPGARAFPPEIEGMSLDRLAAYKVPQYADSSLFRIFRVWGVSPIPAHWVLAMLIIPFAFWAWCGRGSPDSSLMLGLAAWAFLSDAFLPAYRNPYNDIMILNVVALMPMLGGLERSSRVLVIIALGLGVLMTNIHPPNRWWIYLPTLVIVCVALLSVWHSTRPAAVNPLPQDR